ncbi:VOC family protein [Rossellomorea vietnamensis]|uniref:VOC family protein n=1 Tax=Rossellomorea vietnamensis TaxID=218284 RepID=A0A5D4ME49_9BACI|nr:VOC family protein [Rossellomorea vietnamensis]TYR99270.1 VOC family protein [Rossellomorea vietnamensis]
MKNPLTRKIGVIFIPVSDIEKARDWYCDIFGFPADGDLMFGHLYTLPMEGTDIILDSKIYSRENTYKISPFHINTENIVEAYQYMKEKGVKLVSEIQHEHYFTFQDQDGNNLMICQC